MPVSHRVVSDTCYVLSFAIIMLNTSLHNPAVKDKPTVDRFVTMNRGINEGGDLPRELLEVSSGVFLNISFHNNKNNNNNVTCKAQIDLLFLVLFFIRI